MRQMEAAKGAVNDAWHLCAGPVFRAEAIAPLLHPNSAELAAVRDLGLSCDVVGPEQVAAEALAATAQELRLKLAEGGGAMRERQAKLATLQARLAAEAATLEASGTQVGFG